MEFAKNQTCLSIHVEKAVAPHSSTLAWKIPWMEEPGGLQSMGSPRVGHDWVTSLSRIGEGNGNSLQCSCLEDPRDGGTWWAVYGVIQSQTQLKWLSSSNHTCTSQWKITWFKKKKKNAYYWNKLKSPRSLLKISLHFELNNSFRNYSICQSPLIIKFAPRNWEIRSLQFFFSPRSSSLWKTSKFEI